MRILICTPYDLKVPRGNSIAALRLARGLSARGHEASILEGCESMDGDTAAGHLRCLRPELVLVMHAWRCAEAFRAARVTGNVPIVVSLRGTDINEMIEDEERGPVIRSVLEESDAVTVFSEAMRRRVTQHLSHSSDKTSVIPNGLDLPPSRIDYRERIGIDGSAFVIVGLAAIREEKRILWLLDMLSRVRARGRDIIWLHGGPILEEEKGEALRRLCASEPWVRYAGVIPHEEAAAFLRSGDLFISASRSEGMPHSVREAMCVGLPCLLSDIEGHRHMAGDGIEALFFDGEESFFRNLLVLMEDEALRMRLAENGRTRIENEFVGGGEVESYLNLFASLRNGG